MTTESPPVARTRPHGSQLVVLTAAKVVANAALRWVGPFLPTLERAFGAGTGTLTTVIGLGELGGLTTTVTGRHLDTGRQRQIFLAGLAAVGISSLLALVGTTAWFAVAFVILVIGVSNLTIAGHAWISTRVEYGRRARSIGIFETSWALALLIGAPGIALLIEWVGWRGPFVALAIGAAAAWVAVRRLVDDDPRPAAPAAAGVADATTVTTVTVEPQRALPWTAWATLVASALTAAAGLSVFVISGTWLDDRHSVSTGGLGLVAMGFGALELLASSGSALSADRLGKRRAVTAGLVLLGVGLALTAASGDSLLLAVVGLTTFLTGFEYAFVTSLSLVTEAAPLARGRAIGMGNAIGTVARAGAVFASGRLYEATGITGTLILSAAAASVAAVLIALGRR